MRQPGRFRAADLEDALFGAAAPAAGIDDQLGKEREALALEHDQLESRALTEGFEVMRIFTEAHLGLRTAREQRRTDVADAGGDVRVSTEDGQEHTRMMVYGPVPHLADRLQAAPQGEPVSPGRGAELGGRALLFRRGGQAGGEGIRGGAVRAGRRPGQRGGRDHDRANARQSSWPSGPRSTSRRSTPRGARSHARLAPGC